MTMKMHELDIHDVRLLAEKHSAKLWHEAVKWDEMEEPVKFAAFSINNPYSRQLDGFIPILFGLRKYDRNMAAGYTK